MPTFKINASGNLIEKVNLIKYLGHIVIVMNIEVILISSLPYNCLFHPKSTSNHHNIINIAIQ